MAKHNLLRAWQGRQWLDTLDYDGKTGDFCYSVAKRDGSEQIIILAGNAGEIKQAERNRARALTYRLVDTLNAL